MRRAPRNTGKGGSPFEPGRILCQNGYDHHDLAAFDVSHVQPGTVATINGAIVAIMALVLRQHVTPVATLKAKAAAPAPGQS